MSSLMPQHPPHHAPRTNSPTVSAPWYKNYMMTVFVIGMPLIVVIACVFFVIHAFKIKDSTVRDDWYMDGKSLYQDISKDKLAYDLGLSGVMRFQGKPEHYDVRFELKSTTTIPYPKTLTVKISHATDKHKDRDFTLNYQGNNLYAGTLSLDPLPAKYYLNVIHDDGVSGADTRSWRLTHSQKLPANNVPFLPLNTFEETRQSLPDQREKRSQQHAPDTIPPSTQQ